MVNKLFLAFWLMCVGCGALGVNFYTKVSKPVVHAHRGGAALYPENSLWAMVNAAEKGVRVLEMDLQITKDRVVVVSHDPYLASEKVLTPDGKCISADEEKNYAIYSMDYDSLKKYDIGSVPSKLYPDRKNLKCCVPTLESVLLCVESMTKSLGIKPVFYNIEIKSDPSRDSVYSPDYKTYADLCMKVIKESGIGNRFIIQCFDTRTLNYIHKKYPSVTLSYLVEDSVAGFDEIMSRLDFVPEWYSPESKLVDRPMMKKARNLNMKVVPWTVDDKKEADRLKRLGVDAIITNRPDSMLVWVD